jgi:hypothetical protein
MPIRIAFLILVALGLLGCARPLGLVLPKDEPLKLQIYSHGSPTQACVIAPGSPQFIQLEGLLAANRGNWEPIPVTFVPSVLVTGAGFSINFLQDAAVVNYADGQFKPRCQGLRTPSLGAGMAPNNSFKPKPLRGSA